MTRPLWKGPYISNTELTQVKNLKKKHNIILANRNTQVLPKFVGFVVKIYNGKKYTELKVNKEMVNHKFGEFSATRSAFSFKKKKK